MTKILNLQMKPRQTVEMMEMNTVKVGKTRKNPLKKM